MQRRAFVRAAVAGALLPSALSRAAGWPVKPVRYVVPFAPGGTTDILARILGPKLAASLGQSFIVDNKAGAGGVVGADAVAKSAPDGYTILGGTIRPQAIHPALQTPTPYDAAKGFAPLPLIGSTPTAVSRR